MAQKEARGQMAYTCDILLTRSPGSMPRGLAGSPESPSLQAGPRPLFLLPGQAHNESGLLGGSRVKVWQGPAWQWGL
jgi:hypothetical protein